MSMASLSADLATTILGFTYRRPDSLSRVQAALLFPNLWRPKPLQSQTLSYHSKSFRSRLVALDFSKPKRGPRRFTVAATATTTSQSESSDVSTTKIPRDDRIPATIITGFLGSGKVHSFCSLRMQLQFMTHFQILTAWATF